MHICHILSRDGLLDGGRHIMFIICTIMARWSGWLQRLERRWGCGWFCGEMCGLADELTQTSLAAVNSDWSLFIWVIICKRRGITLGAVRGFVSRESKTNHNPMANYVAALWEDVSVLDERFLNPISWGWIVRDGVCFSGVKVKGGGVLALSGTCRKYVLRNFLLYITSTNLLVDTAQFRLTSYGDETLVTETDCKNTRIFLFFILFRFRSKNNEEGRWTAHQYSAEHDVSVGQFVWLSLFTRPVQMGRLSPVLNDICDLIFQSLAVSLRTTRFNIQKFHMVLALRWVFFTDLRTDSDFCFIRH
jgi:hypothetical protein